MTLAAEVDSLLQTFGVPEARYKLGPRTVHSPLTGEVISAIELSESQQAKIVGELRGRYGERLELRFATDPSLIGGLIIRVGDQVLDNSLRTRLSAIQRNMLAG